jgi:redox-sensitive bicupin YhaK (pirin superfamily)
MIQIIKNEERYHFESDWLSTYWHFSFDHYYDPQNMGFGPLRVFNDDVVQPSSGFPTHAHSEMEIVTYVLEGELEHKDSTGASDSIRPGEVQRMSAGTGIRHSEYNPSAEQPVHLLQVWIIPAVSNLPPSYEQLRFTKEQRTGKLLAVASGQDMPDTVKVHQDTTFYVSALRPEDEVTHELGAKRRAYLFVINGKVSVNGHTLASGDQARITDEQTLKLKAEEASEMMLIDLP